MIHIVLVVLLIFLVLLGFPIYLSLGLTSLYYFSSQGIRITTLAQTARTGADNFLLTAIPLFVLAGGLMNRGGITRRLIQLSNALVGHFIGGLALVNVVVSMIFAGMSGSSLSDTAALGSVLIPSMKEEGYDPGFSAAITSASSIVGPIIPPSIPMVVAASLAGISIGGLFLAAAIPGFLFGFLLMVASYFISRKNNYPRYQRSSLKDLALAIKDSFFALLTPVIIVGGILGGIFTATEAAGVAVIYALLVTTFLYKEMTIKDLYEECLSTAKFTGQIMLLVAFINTYNYILTRTRFPHVVFNFLTGITTDPTLIVLLIIFFSLIVGMFLSGTAAIMLVVPLLSPLPGQLGLSNYYFYAIVAIALCFGTLTPPIGLNLYLSSSIANIPIQRTLVSLVPFFIVLLLGLIIVVFIPPLTTWLPSFL